MMVQKILLVSLSLLLLSSCTKAPEPTIVTVPEIIEKDIPIVERPKGLSLTSPYFHVVTAENIDEFIEKFKKSNGSELVFYAVSVRDYENLSLNLAELRRYIEQQQAIIVYYETAIEGDDDVIQDESDN